MIPSESGPDDSVETGRPEAKKYLSISLNSKEVSNASGTFKLNVTANCEWKAVTDAAWITLSKDSAPRGEVIKVSYQANSEGDLRTGVVRFSGEGVSPVTLTIVQGGTFRNPVGGIPDPYIVKDGNKYYLVKAAKGINISHSKKLSELVRTKEVWRPDINSSTAWNTSHIWAPEMHKAPNGKWYIGKLSFWDTLCAAPQDGWDDNVLQW